MRHFSTQNTLKKFSFQSKFYSYWFLVPGMLIYSVLFLLPTILSFFFSMTVWTLKDWKFTGLDNFKMIFSEPSLRIGLKNTLLYGGLTSALKVILGLLLGVFLCSNIRVKTYLRAVVFFPNIISTLAVGLIFNSLMHPTKGLINQTLGLLQIKGPDWLGNTNLALFSIIFVDVWKGVGYAAVIYIAAIMSIPAEYNEALMIDGGNKWDQFRYITVPLSRPAMNSVIILSFIGGLRSFELVWAMTKGGPGFSTDLLSSIIYKQYAGGFYGLATAGNVVLFVVVSLLAFPLYQYLNRKEAHL